MLVVEKYHQSAVKAYMELFRKCRSLQTPTSGFALYAQNLVASKFFYLRNHFSQRTFFLQRANALVAAAIFFESRQNHIPHSVGGFLFSEALQASEIHFFINEIVRAVDRKDFLLPMNGHLNLGFAALYPGDRRDKIGVLTSSHSPGLDHLFSYPEATLHRSYFALETTLSQDQIAILHEEIKETPPEFSTRNISKLHFRRDLAIYNSLVNASMKKHYNFFEMTEVENWDLLRHIKPMITQSLFQFLLYKGKEIGFCFAMLDFNRVLSNSNDLSEFVKIFVNRSKITRGRILSSGILPEFQGQGLFKYLRNRILISFWQRGIAEVESSYIDEMNASSLGNVRSKGGKLSHRYAVFSIQKTNRPAKIHP